MPRLRALAGIAISAIFTAAIALATPQANQAMSFTDLINNQSGNYTWKSSAPAPSTRLANVTDLSTYVNGCAATGTRIIVWSDVLACASGHTPALQTQSVSGNYSTIYYTATYSTFYGTYTCAGPYGSDSYSGTPVTLPAGTAAPTSSATQLSFHLSSITWSGSTSISVTLYNPSGTQAAGPFTTNSPTSSTSTYTYSSAGAPAGAWSWHVTQTGGSEGACDPNSGASGGRVQVNFSGTANFYE